jgi:N-carbamoyl-L-amino-acid hydrolase
MNANLADGLAYGRERSNVDGLTPGAGIRVNRHRLLGRLRRLAEIGRAPGGGITRPGFSEVADEANTLVAAFAREGGLHTRIDAGGNLLISRPSSGEAVPAVLLGSHLDTVVDGGWLDGAYGVLAGLEVLQTLVDQGVVLLTDVVVVAFANEEGTLFPQAFWGSIVLAGMLDALPKCPTDYYGNPLAPALARAGGNLSDLGSAVWPAERLAGYLELHVEQGPVLESESAQIGVVDAIVGRTVLQVDFRGSAAHAGTTPMDDRRDPLVAAAKLTTFVQELPRRTQTCQVGTVGRLQVTPNSPNTIAGHVRMTVDLRGPRLERLDQAEALVHAEVSALAHRSNLRATVVKVVGSQPADMNADLREAISASAEHLGLAYRHISSGAGHDAQIMSRITPTAMIFVPSIGGVSHVPSENTADGDLVAGAEVLLHTVFRLASR